MPKLKEKVENVVIEFIKNNAETEKQIEKIIKKFQENPAEFKQYRTELVGQVLFSEINEQAKSIMDDWMKTNKLLNQKIRTIVAEERENTILKPKEKPADYAIRVSNAIKYLELQGNKLNEMLINEQDSSKTILETADDVLYGILKDFMDDYEQMKLFKQVIKRLLNKDTLEYSNGKTMFPKTFSNFNKYEVIINTFNELEAVANVVFLKGKPRAETYIINNARTQIFSKFEYLGYEEYSNDESIVKLSEIIDNEILRSNIVIE